MKLFLALFLTFSIAHASECEIPLNETEFCINIEWQEGPHLNQSAPRRPHMKHAMEQGKSILLVTFYLKDDSSKAPLEIDGVKIYPWMTMGHHGHISKHNVELLEGNVYKVSEMYFQEMMGSSNWAIRFGVAQQGEEYNYASDFLTSVKIIF